MMASKIRINLNNEKVNSFISYNWVEEGALPPNPLLSPQNF